MARPVYAVFRGCLADTPAMGTLRIRARAALGVDRRSGRIVGVATESDAAPAQLVREWTGEPVGDGDVETTDLGADQLLMPGLVDTHTHAPQFAFLGLGHDLPLMEWLETYTFRHESQFQDADLARTIYADAVRRMVRGGCTMAAYYGTIHLEACCILAETIRDAGQRAYVGKVCMDQNAPDYYSETTDESLQATEAFVHAVLGGQSAADDGVLVRPIITPRFAPTCSARCLHGLGRLARDHQLPIQSHLCESPAEVAFAKECFPDCVSYSAIYHAAGLFGPRTIMAHCVHMSDDDMRLVRECGVGVSHCPNSNFSLSSGVADVRRFVDQGIPVGLGTDVSGGYAPSLLDAMRMAAAASRTLVAARRDSAQPAAGSPLDAAELLFLATQGGARVMGMQASIGTLDEGKLFDALVVDFAAPGSPVPPPSVTPAVLRHQQADELEQAWRLRIEQFVFLADDRNIARVYVGGRLIHAL
ncbi:hypothetical protein LPJ61_000766 [Coemansia biformis]|uniref:Guanine deaminase n=1 Tax=Coemansia biformis TaxID=1286918 RepID=A0A9W8D079_9FUNG|nr:hypothetical protein LPJ61_000766 [Coemansia biformis]